MPQKKEGEELEKKKEARKERNRKQDKYIQ